ncbi:MAG: hypothetical protein KJ720_04935 [Proteobacteria bacterium]|nr:hypothetical protein [Pseudomonadota bacterium]MBU1452170.1 hypothetical protein [Pseudomonadota bacterium]MBU2469978.1 hypothetical protein [Pseudomonadota bacterium]MBU2518938.1 hypothetical protein [Pseudomonadota bacterium]
MPYLQLDKKYFNKLTIALGLLAVSGFFFLGFWFYTGDLAYISTYFYIHLAFLPIHALVLGLILDELIQLREKIERRKRLNMFLGIFFRQMGMDIMLNLLNLVKNREDFDDRLLVDKTWGAARFRRARRDLAGLKLRMDPNARMLAALMEVLASREEDIIAMTRNPLMLEFESLHHCLLSLFHLIEESHFRGPMEKLRPEVLRHLGQDAGKALIRLASLWLAYLEHLKDEHPVLFGFQVGLHSSIQPMMLDENGDELDD